MKKLIVIVFIGLIGHSTNAQLNIYIRPTINMKTNQGSFRTVQNIFSSNQMVATNVKMLSNEYFTFINDRMFFDNNNISFGIKLGLDWKKHNFEIGIADDNSSISTGLLATFHSTNPETPDRYNYGRTREALGSDYLLFSLDYNYKVWQSSKKTVEFRLGAGTGLQINSGVNRKKGEYKQTEIYAPTLGELKPDVFNYAHLITTYKPNLISPYLKASIGFDFYTKKQRNILSIDIFYLQGLKFVQTQFHDVFIMDNGINKDYRFYATSRGSGFYFQISRKFQLYPWIPLSKKKREANKL